MKKYKLADGVTQSLLTSFSACRLRTKLTLEGWMYPAPRESLFFGSLFHKILEFAYSGKEIGLDLRAFLKKEQKLSRAINSEIVEKSFAMAEALFDPYLEFWIDEDIEKEWIKLEPTFDLEFNNQRIRGRIDGVFELKGKLWLLETKTKAQIDEYGLLDQLAVDFQNLFYVCAAEKLFDRKVRGVLYNIVRKPNLKQKKNESMHNYSERMKTDVEIRPEHYFKRYEVIYSRRQIDEFKEEVVNLIDDYRAWITGSMMYTWKNRTSCVGRWNCEFLASCAQRDMSGYVQKRKLFQELI